MTRLPAVGQSSRRGAASCRTSLQIGGGAGECGDNQASVLPQPTVLGRVSPESLDQGLRQAALGRLYSRLPLTRAISSRRWAALDRFAAQTEDGAPRGEGREGGDCSPSISLGSGRSTPRPTADFDDRFAAANVDRRSAMSVTHTTTTARFWQLNELAPLTGRPD